MEKNKLYKLLKSYNHHINLALSMLIFVAASSCSEKKTYSGDKEGKIVYDVTYPYEEPSLILDLYPKELNFYFKGDLMNSELKSSYDLISSGLIIDNKRKEYTQLFKNMRDRHVIKLDEDDTHEWLKQHPNLRLEPTNEVIEIIGRKCNKILAHLPDGKSAPLELYCTKELDLSMDNWWNQYEGVDGFLLGYDIEMYGKRMRVRAREISYEPVNDLKFRIPVNYEEVSPKVMNEKLIAMVTEYTGQ